MRIHYLAMIGNIDEIKQSLSEQPELLNVQEEYSYNTLLMVAISARQLLIANFLLLHKDIDVFVRNRDGLNILHFLLLEIVSAKSKEREAYYDIAATILHLDAQCRIHNPTVTPLLETQDKSGYTPLIMVSSSKNEEIRHTILDMAKKAQEDVQAKLKEREAQKEMVRLQLYSEKLPSILRERNKETKTSYQLFSFFSRIWDKKQDEKPTSLEPERESLLGRKIKVE